jgi:transposase
MGTSDFAVIEAVSSHKALPTVKRQRRSVEFKRRIVEESLAEGASVARVARAHGVNANQVFTWRRLYRQGQLGTGSSDTPKLLVVRVAETPLVPEPASGNNVESRSRNTEARRTSSVAAAERAGTIQIELPKGRLRLTGVVDTETLRVVLEALGG